MINFFCAKGLIPLTNSAFQLHEQEVRSPQVDLTPVAFNGYSAAIILNGSEFLLCAMHKSKCLHILALTFFTHFSVLWMLCAYMKIKIIAWIKDFAYSEISFILYSLAFKFFPSSEKKKITPLHSLANIIFLTFLEYQRCSDIPVKPLLAYRLSNYVISIMASSLLMDSEKKLDIDTQIIFRTAVRIAVALGTSFFVERVSGSKVLMNRNLLILTQLSCAIFEFAFISPSSPLNKGVH